jgi:deazaflavin-dependent oxidoreductase (nitroreductase family)
VGDLVGVSDHADLDYCYLTTTGRVTGRPHEIEIWFALHGDTLYLLSGGGERSDWVRNLIRDPQVTIRIGDLLHAATARVVTDDDERELAGTLLVEKYRPRYSGDLTTWQQRSLPVAVVWDEPTPGGD